MRDDDQDEYDEEGGESEEEETVEEEKDSNYDSNYGTAAKDHRPSQTLVTCENDLEDDMERSMNNPYNDGAVLRPKWIGNVRCFLHDANGRPRITIGPNWGFTIFLSLLVGGSLYVSIGALIHMGKRGADWYWMAIGAVIIVIGMWSFLRTFLGNPGIPEEVYRMRAKPSASRERLPPINDKGYHLCEECNVYLLPEREHCDLCDVCIDHPDHHCVFYSKCIGGGNVWHFRLSLVMFVVNMSYFFLAFGLVQMTKKHGTIHQDTHHLL